MGNSITFGSELSLKFKTGKLRTLDFLEKLPTPRLLKYFKKHRHLQRLGLCDCGCGEPLTELYDLSPSVEEYYKDCYNYIYAIKEILNKREHI